MKYIIRLRFTKHQVEFRFKGNLHHMPLSEFKKLKGNIKVLKDLLNRQYIYTETF